MTATLPAADHAAGGERLLEVIACTVDDAVAAERGVPTASSWSAIWAAEA